MASAVSPTDSPACLTASSVSCGLQPQQTSIDTAHHPQTTRDSPILIFIDLIALHS
jgi:hypothetical protein